MPFRTSLAGRVTLLATIAVGLAVAIVALAGYLTMRHQLYASIDESLHARAQNAAQEGTVKDIKPSAPPWLPGATDALT